MYYGDIRLGDTIDIKFTTRQISGAPFTLAGSPVISAYVGNGTTEITAGITLTVDFDARTGLNNVRVVASSGNGFATATNVQLVITTGTVNSVSMVGEVIGEFSIEARSGLMPTTAARTLDVSATGEAGIDWANIGSPTTAVNLSATNIDVDQIVASVSGAVGSVTGAVGSVTGAVGSVTGAVGSVTTVSSGAISEASYATTAGSFAPLGVVDQGTAQSASSTGVVLRAAAAFADDTLIGCTIGVLGSTQGYWQFREIIDNVLSTDAVTVDAWTVTPSGTITYRIFGGSPVSSTYIPAVNVTQFNGVAATSSGGRPEVNTSHVGGTIQTAGDIPARLPAALVSGRMDSSVGAMAANVITATAINADAITDAKVASDVTIASVTGAVGSVTGAVGSVTGNVGGNVTGSVGSVGSVATGGITAASFAADAITAAKIAADVTTELQAGLATSSALSAIDTKIDTIDNFLDTEIAAIKVTTDKLDTMIETSSDGWIYTIAALQQGSSGGGATAADISDAVWDEILSGHAVVGSAGAALAAAGSAGDPWSTVLPGAYGAGTAGKIVGDNINATISSRAAASVLGAAVGASISADIAAVKTQTAAIETDTQDIQTRIPAALVSGRIDASVGAMAANVMTAAAAASDLTTELQAGLATAAALTTVSGNVDAILLDTGTDGVVVAAASKTGYRLSSTGVDDVLDEVVEGTTTLRESVRLANSAMGGKASGLATTGVAFRDLADTKDRITATVDADGNRSAVTRDLT